MLLKLNTASKRVIANNAVITDAIKLRIVVSDIATTPVQEHYNKSQCDNCIEQHFVQDKSVLGSVDDLGDDDDDTGEGNEEIEVDLTKTSANIREILFTVSIYWDSSNSSDPRARYNFGQVRDAYIQIINAVNNEVICRYDLDEDFSTDKGVEFGRLYRRGNEWKFQAVGDAHKDGLEPICRKYASKFM